MKKEIDFNRKQIQNMKEKEPSQLKSNYKNQREKILNQQEDQSWNQTIIVTTSVEKQNINKEENQTTNKSLLIAQKKSTQL